MDKRNRPSAAPGQRQPDPVEGDDTSNAQSNAGQGPRGRKKENVDTVEGFGDDSNLLKLMNQPPQEFGTFYPFRSFTYFPF